MAKERVDITCDADVARAIEKIVSLAREYNKIGDAAQDVGEKGKKASNEWAQALDGVVGKWFTISKAIDLAVAGVKRFLDEQAKLRAEQVGATRAIDAGLTSYRIAQGNLSDNEGLSAASRILGVAQQTKALPETAFAGATTLASYKVGRDEAEGSALRELLELRDVVSTQGNMDAGSFSASVLSALDRSKTPITGANIKRFGQTAFGLSQQLKGFDAGEMQITGDVATYGRNAGMGFDETMAIVGSLSEAYGEGTAKKKFKSLFGDSKFTPEEKVKVAEMRARAGELLGSGSSAYSGAQAIADSSMANRSELAETQYQMSGFKPGITDPADIRKNLITSLRNRGVGSWGQTLAGINFDLMSWITGSPESAIKWSTSAHPEDFGFPADPRQKGIREEALGQKEMVIKLQTYDGRDIPAETSAEGLNQPSGTDRSGNFGP